MDIHTITVEQYLDLASRGNTASGDQRAFAKINAQLREAPLACERLAFELLQVAWRALDGRSDPRNADTHSLWVTGFARCLQGFISPERLAEYAGWLERIIFRCFDLLGPVPPGTTGMQPFEFTMEIACDALRRTGTHRYRVLLQTLGRQASETGLAYKSEVVARIAKRITEQP